jgi:inosose dehydratase
MKNIRQSVLDDSRKTGRSFLNSIRAGIFTVPGDSSGAIDFQPILQELAKVNYRGWLMVEAEQDPNKAEPLQYALMARKYLQKLIGF